MTTSPESKTIESKNSGSNHVAMLVILAGFLIVLAAIVGAQFLGKSGEPIGDAQAPVNAACVAARDELVTFGKLADQMENAELGDRIDTETAVLRSMVAEFEVASTGNGDGQAAFNAWVADWNALIDARDVAVEQIRLGYRPTAWLPPEEQGKTVAIDGRMDEYSRREDVRACTTDMLAADTLDGQRFYRQPEN